MVNSSFDELNCLFVHLFVCFCAQWSGIFWTIASVLVIFSADDYCRFFFFALYFLSDFIPIFSSRFSFCFNHQVNYQRDFFDRFYVLCQYLFETVYDRWRHLACHMDCNRNEADEKFISFTLQIRPRCLVVSKSSFKITFVYIFLFNLFYMLNFHKFGVVLLKQKPSILSDEAREK